MFAPNFSFEQEQQFFLDIQQSIENQSFDRLILSQYKGELAQLEKMTFRQIDLQGQATLSCLYHYPTQDMTKNYSIDEGLEKIAELLSQSKQANLFTLHEDVQLKKNKKKAMLSRQKKQAEATKIEQQHNREKHRYVQQQSPFLKHLGITDEKGQVIPSMARKWKQINKFIEIFSNAYEQIDASQQALNIVDFGSGKGYLTFALYDYLQAQNKTPLITGVELRSNLVEFCQQVADEVGFNHLDFFEGDVRSYSPEKLDVMIALHACDIATDFAIHTGIRLNASMIMCAPCCHKELRPQLKSPEVLQPMLQFGIHAGQQAEMLTDTLRALLLKAYGYETKVFEFVSLEHTSKNKMILATKRKDIQQPDTKIMQQIQALKEMYGIQKQSLELLLQDQMPIENIGCKC
ncbi:MULTISPECIES: SAM-dependent methyltransferase [Acinetobacter]|uniref:class I SAM-dependent methyltransferase n=2 Tax=Moraxellaceae TaxID=468 RepID=UPI000C662806|nr:MULTISPECIES: SAM-dependent methyltransferase [Acinetobacter]MBC67512.1 methyltransferase [Acinetobacter sp.]MBT48994.1 methyltransferase [Acinetobacter sp.]HIQ33820.1 SAM-dependent methyltransferase [Acinetobacter venetianus]HJP47012.1 SAM-dependent methyltransferase [Acinetobacter venetianus]